jgi:hypothetical protein
MIGLLRGRRRLAPDAAAGVGLAMAVLALLFALNLFQLTAPGPAHRAIRRAVASLTEIDSLLAVQGPSLRQQAEASSGEPLSLPGYPLDVPLSPQEALQPPDTLRDLVLDRSAEQVYEEGSAAFREEGQSAGSSGLSVQGAVRTGLGFLTAGNHDALRWTTAVLAVVSGLAAAVLMLLMRGYDRLIAIGGAVAGSSLLFLLLTAVVRLALGIAARVSGDYITVQLLDLTKGTAWIPLRNGVAFSALGLALLALGLTGSRLSRARP